MKVLSKYKFILSFIVYLVILTTLITILNMIFNIGGVVNNVICLCFMFGFVFISNLKNGKNIVEKGYIEGLKRGLVYVLCMYLVGSIFFGFSIPLKRFIYYVIILISSVFGAIIGINKRKK